MINCFNQCSDCSLNGAHRTVGQWMHLQRTDTVCYEWSASCPMMMQLAPGDLLCNYSGWSSINLLIASCNVGYVTQLHAVGCCADDQLPRLLL